MTPETAVHCAGTALLLFINLIAAWVVRSQQDTIDRLNDALDRHSGRNRDHARTVSQARRANTHR